MMDGLCVIQIIMIYTPGIISVYKNMSCQSINLSRLGRFYSKASNMLSVSARVYLGLSDINFDRMVRFIVTVQCYLCRIYCTRNQLSIAPRQRASKKYTRNGFMATRSLVVHVHNRVNQGLMVKAIQNFCINFFEYNTFKDLNDNY